MPKKLQDINSLVRRVMYPPYWARGASYFREGRVRNIQFSYDFEALIVSASIQGTKNYITQLHVF